MSKATLVATASNLLSALLQNFPNTSVAHGYVKAAIDFLSADEPASASAQLSLALALYSSTSLTYAQINAAISAVNAVTSSGGGSGTPGGSTTQVQFNDSGALGGDAGLTYDKTNKILSVNSVNPVKLYEVDTATGQKGGLTFTHGINAEHSVMAWGPNFGIVFAGPYSIDNVNAAAGWVVESNWSNLSGHLQHETYWTDTNGNNRVISASRDTITGTASSAFCGQLAVDGTQANMRAPAGQNTFSVLDNVGGGSFVGVQIRNTNGTSHGVRLELGGTDRDTGGWHLLNDPDGSGSDRFGIWNNFIGGYPVLIDKTSNTVGIGYGYADTLTGYKLDVNGTANALKLVAGAAAGAQPSGNALLHVGPKDGVTGAVVPASTKLYLAGPSGGSSLVTYIRTASFDDNASYGTYWKANYSSGAFGIFGTRDGAVDTDVFQIKGSAIKFFGDRVIGATQSTTMTTGFDQIPGAAGAPTGVPADTTGIPLYYDKTNNKIYAYNGAWKSVTLA
jgi:hypothetical protein